MVKIVFTKEYKEILEHIKNLNESPFTYPLSEYCSAIVENPRCCFCDKREKGIECGKSPKFDREWTKGWLVCFHICHLCNSKSYEAKIRFLRNVGR